MQPSQLLTAVLSSAFLLYICYSLWTLSQLFTVIPCDQSTHHCILPLLKDGDHVQVTYQCLSAVECVCSFLTMMMFLIMTDVIALVAIFLLT